MKWVVLYKDGQLKQLGKEAQDDKRMKKTLQIFYMSQFLHLSRNKTSKILTQLTKPQLFTGKKLTFYIPATACMDYAHSHHWPKIIWCRLGNVVAKEVTFSFDTWVWKEVASYLSFLSCTHIQSLKTLEKTNLYLNVLNNFLNSKLETSNLHGMPLSTHCRELYKWLGNTLTFY